MKRFVMCLILSGLFLTGCIKQEPATVATISPGPEIVEANNVQHS